jgi:hypothetical protein
MLKIIDDTTNAQNVTTFEFNDGSTLDAIQAHGTAGAPFIAVSAFNVEQGLLVRKWSNCVLKDKRQF